MTNLIPVKGAEWNNPPAGFHNQDIHVYCSNDIPDWNTEIVIFCSEPILILKLMELGCTKTQIFYAPDGLESFIQGENESKEIVRGDIHPILPLHVEVQSLIMIM